MRARPAVTWRRRPQCAPTARQTFLSVCRLPPLTTLFLADLHLSPNHRRLMPTFRRFATPPAGGALYILNDLFEFWLGDDDDRPF